MLMTINDVLKSKTLAVSTVVLVLIVIWYCSAVMLNAPFQRALDERAKLNPTTGRFIAATLDQKRPVLKSCRIRLPSRSGTPPSRNALHPKEALFIMPV